MTDCVLTVLAKGPAPTPRIVDRSGWSRPDVIRTLEALQEEGMVLSEIRTDPAKKVGGRMRWWWLR